MSIHLDHNPATQGSSLTEGKRTKRSKKTNGETNGDGRVSDEGDQGGHAPDKATADNVR